MCAGWRLFYLPCKDATQADDDQDVEDGWADDGAHADVSFGDENACGWVEEEEVKKHDSMEVMRQNWESKQVLSCNLSFGDIYWWIHALQMI